MIEICDKELMDGLQFVCYCDNISLGAPEIAEQLYAQMLGWA